MDVAEGLIAEFGLCIEFDVLAQVRIVQQAPLERLGRETRYESIDLDYN